MSSQDEDAMTAAEILTRMTNLSSASRQMSNDDRRITNGQQPNTSRRMTTAVADLHKQVPSNHAAVKQPPSSESHLRQETTNRNATYHQSTRTRVDIRTRREETRKFCLLEELCKQDSIMFDLATKYLRPRDMLNLYCISKVFHFIVNHKLPSFILASARHWADLTPHNQRKSGPNLRQHCYDRFDITTQLPFNAYRRLCVIDPTRRILPGAPGLRRRHVPSFRYLLFVVHRVNTIKSICYQMALRALRLPLDIAPSVLAKISFVMDFATNGARIGLMHSPTYWTNNDIYVGLLICVKLDMAFSDPIEGENGEAEALMRQLMFAQRSLSTLNKVLRREKMRSQVELLRMWVEWKYIPQPEHVGMPIMGLPPHKIGHLQYEGWALPPGSDMADVTTGSRANTAQHPRVPKLLLRPDQLIVRESVRRGLNLETHLLDMLFWGFVHSETLENVENIGVSLLRNRIPTSFVGVDKDANNPPVDDDMSDDEMGWSKLELIEKSTEAAYSSG